MTAPAGLPAWARELDLALPLHPQILCTGNVRDQFVLPAPGSPSGVQIIDLPAMVWRTCEARGFQALATFDAVSGTLLTRSAPGDDPLPPPLRSVAAGKPLDAGGLRELITAIVRHPGPPIGLLVPYAARLAPAEASLDADERLLLAAVEVLGHTAPPTRGTGMTPYNTIFWVCERQEELHPTFPLGSHGLRVIRVPQPDLSSRHSAARFVLNAGDGDAAKRLADVTHGLTVRDVLTVGRLARDRELPPDEYDEAARLVRIGVADDKWSADALRDKIVTAREYLSGRVLGQQRAVDKTIDILRRSAVGLNGAQQASSPNRPRGVLFLAGPTGVGKTELAKAVASLVLGEGAQPLRFDMSEFGTEHSDQRLIGAPPGYVGHDAGGELTNAVRSQPVCVLLFDEIEKANRKILDLFLQILEDGRLTDGRGATVYFTECFLIFTSNLGVTRGPAGPLVHPGMEPHGVEAALYREFIRFFNEDIGRPELRNRFGDSYVVLDFIRPEIVPAILDRMLGAVSGRVRRTHKAALLFGDQARKSLVAAALARLDDLNDGGRGIATMLETALVNPLAAEIFDRPVTPGEQLTVTGLEESDGFWHIDVTREMP